MQQNSILSQSPDQESQPSPKPSVGNLQKREGFKNAASTILILIIAPLIALFLTAFVFQSYEVDGASMETTLQDRDRLIVWKLPRTISRITGNAFIPPRGEVVIFIKHGIEQYDPGQDKQLIKRVLGLPGERIVIRDNQITIYNSQHPEGFNPDTQGLYTPVQTDAPVNIDLIIPDGELFVAGDNRPNSLDSRAFGTVPAKDMIGTLAYRIFPLNKAKAF
ncbi:MAG TPA: signal peptidase I [Candidatus Limnocylindria bacterium]|nr:signal peptidase I [Candidatus Limnocylindria bacterium]